MSPFLSRPRLIPLALSGIPSSYYTSLSKWCLWSLLVGTDSRIREIVGQRSDAGSGRLRPIRFVTLATGDLCHDFHSAAAARRRTTFQLSGSKSYEIFSVDALDNPTIPSKDSIFGNVGEQHHLMATTDCYDIVVGGP